MGAESTCPCAQVKYLADLLRNRVNSQWYPRIYEDRRAKIVENIEKSEVRRRKTRRVLQDKKVPGTSSGTRVAAAPGPAPTGSAAGFLGDSKVNGSLPCHTRFEQHQEGPGCLKWQGGE